VTHELGASYGRGGFRKAFLAERNRLRGATRSLPWSALLLQPVSVPIRWALIALTGEAEDPRRHPSLVLPVMLGTLAGLIHVPDALRKRLQDRRDWKVGEIAMLAHLVRQGIWSRDQGILDVTSRT
jgi:hypothetical protein